MTRPTITLNPINNCRSPTASSDFIRAVSPKRMDRHVYRSTHVGLLASANVKSLSLNVHVGPIYTHRLGYTADYYYYHICVCVSGCLLKFLNTYSCLLAWAYLGGFRDQPPNKTVSHKNTHKINRPQKSNPKTPTHKNPIPRNITPRNTTPRNVFSLYIPACWSVSSFKDQM